MPASKLVEREILGPLHQTGDLQAERRGVEHRVAEVLRREELIARRQQAVDLPEVQDPVRLAEDCRKSLGQVEKRHHRFALRERRHGPVGNAEGTQTGGQEASSENRSTADVPDHGESFRRGAMFGWLPTILSYITSRTV